MSGNGAARAANAVAPGIVSALGMSIPLAPACIGVLAAFLVRAPLLKPGTPGFVSELTITLACMLGTFVTIVDHGLSPGVSFWLGIGMGGLGSGIIELGKSFVGGAVKSRLQEAAKVLFNVK